MAVAVNVKMGLPIRLPPDGLTPSREDVTTEWLGRLLTPILEAPSILLEMVRYLPRDSNR
jgi:hypothetical protein